MKNKHLLITAIIAPIILINSIRSNDHRCACSIQFQETPESTYITNRPIDQVIANKHNTAYDTLLHECRTKCEQLTGTQLDYPIEWLEIIKSFFGYHYRKTIINSKLSHLEQSILLRRINLKSRHPLAYITWIKMKEPDNK